jgi:hypothetical protein
VVCGDKSYAVKLVYNLKNSCKLKVESLHRALGCKEGAGVAYHITVGEINAKILVLTASETLNKLVGDLRNVPPRR